MIVRLSFFVYFLNVIFVESGYPPLGDEVQAGSVLLPATRRGRYLANIVRRQAVDGTGIKFNKDADRMNADAKKKVDVLSEELLPYIIAEQERRTTLYKRVMTAIQNGEKGVTIAEIRNKPPLIIRKGLMYRCPANRSPKEPDGSGVIMCETDIEPTPVMYDSCLSAEDKELYVADARYFFCNRHKIEGPDLPRNGTTVIGCAPLERTSLNYTSSKCALEDTDDVVVHYRYYPDKTYKFVTELDPDHEVCDHWNPCQIGYIYSLPSPDQAMPANELWRDYEERPDEYERDEIIPPIPEDNPDEFVPDDSRDSYEASPRRLEVPEGFKFHGIGRFNLQNMRSRLTHLGQVLKNFTNIKVKIEPPPPEARRRHLRQGDVTTTVTNTDPTTTYGTESSDDQVPGSGAEAAEAAEGSEGGEEEPEEPAAEAGPTHITVQFFFAPVLQEDFTTYYVRFESETQPGTYKYRTILVLHRATIQTKVQEVDLLPGQVLNTTSIPLRCGKCTLRSLMVRAFDGGITNLDRSKFRVRSEVDADGRERRFIDIELGKTRFTDFGDYFIVVQTEDGNEERLKALSVRSPDSTGTGITVHRLFQTVDVGSHIDNTVKYECDGCICEDVLCDGESVLSSGRISIVTASKFISFNFPSFENENACVYIGVFKDAEGKALKRTLQVIENASPAVGSEITKVTSLPPEGSQFEYGVPYTCQGDCSVDKLSLNGVPLENMPATRRQASPVGIAFFMYTPLEIIIRITSFSLFYCGVYQALFNTPEGPVTKSVLEIKNPYDTGEVDEEPEATADEGSAGSAADETVAEEAGDASASQVNGNSTDTNDTETDTTTTIVEEP